MTLDELSEQVAEILFECGVFETVDFSEVIEHMDFRVEPDEKSDIEKIIDKLPDRNKIEVIKNVVI